MQGKCPDPIENLLNMTQSPHKRILALDLATQCGWALMASGVLTSGTESFHRYAGCKSKPAEHVGQPFVNFHVWLREKLRTDKPEAIAYEKAAHFASAGANDLCIGLRGIMMLQAAAMNIPVHPYYITSVKKFWTGSGKAEKPAMIAEVIRRFPDYDGYHIDDNEADAIAILHLHLSTIST